MKIALHPSAEQDLREAAEFYEREGSPLVASRFVAEFRRLVSLVGQNPQMGSPRSNGRRALLMRVFPYSVIYRATVDEILILVVKHDGRRPGYGRRRS